MYGFGNKKTDCTLSCSLFFERNKIMKQIRNFTFMFLKLYICEEIQ